MKLKRVIAIGAAVLAVALTSGCIPERGEVTNKSTTLKQPCNREPCTIYEVCVEDTSKSQAGCGKVSKEVYNKCSKGERWPDCKED